MVGEDVIILLASGPQGVLKMRLLDPAGGCGGLAGVSNGQSGASVEGVVPEVHAPDDIVEGLGVEGVDGGGFVGLEGEAALGGDERLGGPGVPTEVGFHRVVKHHDGERPGAGAAEGMEPGANPGGSSGGGEGRPVAGEADGELAEAGFGGAVEGDHEVGAGVEVGVVDLEVGAAGQLHGREGVNTLCEKQGFLPGFHYSGPCMGKAEVLALAERVRVCQ